MTVLLSIVGVLGLLGLIAAAALFVAAEYSLTTLERVQVDAHVKHVGDRRAKNIQQAQRSLSFQLSGAQLGITITTLATGYVAEPAVASLLSPGLRATGLSGAVSAAIAAVFALLLATGLSVVFGELVPKNLAIARPLGTARAVAGAQMRFSAVLRWLINGLNESANWTVRRMGIEPQEELRSARSPRELGSLVRSSAQQGTIDQGTATLLDRSLRFGDRTAEELMTPRLQVESLPTDATVLDLLEAARRTGFSRFPIFDGDMDDVRGAVHVKQAFNIPAAHRASTRVATLVRPVPTVPTSLSSDALLERLRDSGLQLAVVVDEWGGNAGMVTMEDLVEEIVGDVRDEHDRSEAPRVRPLGRNSWMISGLLRADEVSDATGFAMPPGEYETLAGMVVDRLGRIPRVGDEVRVNDWRLTVMRMERHRLAELRLSDLDGATAPEPTTVDTSSTGPVPVGSGAQRRAVR